MVDALEPAGSDEEVRAALRAAPPGSLPRMGARMEKIELRGLMRSPDFQSQTTAPDPSGSAQNGDFGRAFDDAKTKAMRRL